MIFFFKMFSSVLIFNFVINQERNLSCDTNETFYFYNITEIKITKINFKYLNQILKKNENETINLILKNLDIENLEDMNIYNSYVNQLDLFENYVQVLPENFFSRLKFIKELNIGLNKFFDLTSFYSNIDKNLCAFLYLEKLDLSNNEIISLVGNNFDKLENLKFLNLEFNKIKSFSSFDFNKFHQIRELTLGNDEMVIDEEFLFENFSNLESLKLMFCEFKSLNSRLFAGLRNLKSLFLLGKNLDNLTENIFYETRNLNK